MFSGQLVEAQCAAPSASAAPSKIFVIANSAKVLGFALLFVVLVAAIITFVVTKSPMWTILVFVGAILLGVGGYIISYFFQQSS